jgi:hypothetical protein
VQRLDDLVGQPVFNLFPEVAFQGRVDGAVSLVDGLLAFLKADGVLDQGGPLVGAIEAEGGPVLEEEKWGSLNSIFSCCSAVFFIQLKPLY